MIHSKISRVINIPQEKVWELLSDVTTVDQYNRNVERVDLNSPNKVGVGAGRTCHFYDGTSVKELVTEASDKRLKLVLSDLPISALKEINAEILAEPVTSSSTEVSFNVHYTVKYGPFGYLFGVLMMKPMLTSTFKEILAGIDYRLSTGKAVQKPQSK